MVWNNAVLRKGKRRKARVISNLFLKAPLGEVYAHSIGEIKGIIVDKIEDIEPPLAHVVSKGAGHDELVSLGGKYVGFVKLRQAAENWQLA